MLTVLTVFSALVLIRITLVPVRPSRENVISGLASGETSAPAAVDRRARADFLLSARDVSAGMPRTQTQEVGFASGPLVRSSMSARTQVAKHNLFLLEDAAEAIGVRYKSQRLGGHGDCCAFSFFGNKIVTTGEGAMVNTNDDALASRLRLFRGQGMDPQQRYWFQVAHAANIKLTYSRT